MLQNLAISKKTTSTTGTSVTTTTNNKDLNKSVDVKKETSFKSSKKLK